MKHIHLQQYFSQNRKEFGRNELAVIESYITGINLLGKFSENNKNEESTGFWIIFLFLQIENGCRKGRNREVCK